MTNRIATLTILLSTGVAAQSYIDATNGQTLEQLAAAALARSPEILAARAEIEIARGGLQQASLRPNPTLTAGRREDPGGTDNQTSMMVQVPLDLFRRKGRVDTATETLAAAELAVADRERLLVAAVRERAGAVLIAARLLGVIDDLLVVTRRTHELLGARVSEGATPPLDRDVAEVEVRRLEADRLSRLAEAEAALLELRAVLGLAPDAVLTLRDDLEQQLRSEAARPLNTASQTLENIVAERPDVREGAARVREAEARIRELRREGRFDMTVYGSYMRMDTGFPQRGFNAAGGLERVRGVFQYAEAGGMLTLPLFNRNQGAIAAAEAEKTAAEHTHHAHEVMARADITAARVRDEQTRKGLDVLARARDLARRNVEIVRESYQLGKNTLFEVFAEQRRLLDIEMAYADALAKAFEARTALVRATGDRP